MSKKEKFQIKLDDVYKEISMCKRIQSIQLWDSVDIVKKTIKRIIKI